MKRSSPLLRLLTVSHVGILLLAPASPGQEPAATSASPTATADRDVEVVKLSPFEVRADVEAGYYSSNTSAGTRLNTRLEDVGASITVVNKQQLQDTAAIDLNDIFLYEANTEGTGQFTDFAVDRNGNLDDRIQRAPESANRIRGIGSANISRGSFATGNRVPVDSYNIDSLEISRGPNATLSGLGVAAGTVNINIARANLQRAATSASFRIDDLGGYRATFDLNRPLIADKLALRVTGLREQKQFTRKPSEETTTRVFGALTYKPFRSTVVRGSFESYWNYRQLPNSITPRDGISDWIEHGSPTWDPVTFRANVRGVYTSPITTASENNAGRLPEGLFSAGTGLYNRPSMYIGQTGQVELWTTNQLGTVNPNTPNSNVRNLLSGNDVVRYRGDRFPLFVSPGIADQALYDWDSVNFVATNWSKAWADTMSLELEQRLATGWHLQLGWLREDYKNYDRNVINASSTLYVDVNERLLDGRPNPYLRRPFLYVSEPTFFRRPALQDNLRVQLAGDVDFTRNESRLIHVLGHHKLVGYGERRKTTSSLLRFREAVLDNHWYLSPTNRTNGSAAARATYRYYLGDTNGYNVDYAPAKSGVAGTYDFYYLDPRPNPDVWVNEPSYFNEAAYVSNRSQDVIDTYGGGLQSYFWNDRIVTTVGYRKDSDSSRNSNGAAVDPATGHYTYDELAIWQDWQDRAGDTMQYGIVVKPLKWLGVYYNWSDSFQPAGPAADLFGELLPNPSGEGKDYGVFFNFKDDKFVARVNFYKNLEINSRNGDAGIVASRARRLDFGTDGFNLEDRVTAWLTADHPTWSAQQIRSEMYKIIKLPEGFIERVTPLGTADVNDVTSRGMEIELNYNPSPEASFKLTVGKQQTINSAISPKIADYIAERLPIWQSIMAPGLDGRLGTPDDVPWWTDGGNSAEEFYDGSVIVPYRVAIAQQGKPKSQIRKYSASLLARYSLAKVSENPLIKRLTVGGTLRWQDKGSIGFYGIPDPDGVIRDLDASRPVWDKARTSLDVWASWTFQTLGDKVRTRVQLNVRNVQESGGLRTISVNPDGSPSQFRIIDPRQFILTTTFDL